MELVVKAKTNVDDLIIDYIEARLTSGRTVSLNWDYSGVTRCRQGFAATYTGVLFGEEYADGRVDELKDMKITNVGLYSETNSKAALTITEMIFYDKRGSISFQNPFSIEGGDASG